MAINIQTQSLLNTIQNLTILPDTNTIAPTNIPRTLLTYTDCHLSGTAYLTAASPKDIVDIAFSLRTGTFEYNSITTRYSPRLSYSIGWVKDTSTVGTGYNIFYNNMEEMAKHVDKYPILVGCRTDISGTTYSETILQTYKDSVVYQTLFNNNNLYTRNVSVASTKSKWNSTDNITSWKQVYWASLEPAQQKADTNRINGSEPFYYASMNGWTTLCELDTTSSNDVIIGALGIQNRDGTTISNNSSINDILDVCKDKGLPIRNRETGGFMKVSSNGVDGYIISELCMRPKTLTLTSIKVGTPVSYVMTLNGATSKNFALKEIPQYYDLAYMNSKLTHASLIAKYATVNLCGLGSTYLSGSHTIDDIITKMGWTIDGKSLADIYTSSGKETALYYLYSMFYSCAANRYRLYDTYSNSDIRVISINDTQTSYDAIMLRCDTGKLTYVSTSSSTQKHSYIWPMTAFATFSFYFDSSGSMNAYIFPEGTWTTVIPG